MTKPCPQAALRPPETVMRLARMGVMFPTRLSFLRVLTRNLFAQNARVSRPIWEMDAQGHGLAVYTVSLDGYDYSLIALSHDLPNEVRSDRVIATAWDAAFVLFDGVPEAEDLARIRANAPLQEAGRFGPRDLVLSRANKSLRLFTHVVHALQAGQQPKGAQIDEIGYLMRTTAVYGNGKFGLADRALYADRPAMSGPFAAEMLAVWLIRGFTHDLAEHLGGAPLAPALKRHLGVGNATGLGMAPFLVSHPVLLNNWMLARETAIARVRMVGELPPDQQQALLALAARAQEHLAGWHVPDEGAKQDIRQTRVEWAALRGALPLLLKGSAPIEAILHQASRLSLQTQELTLAWALEGFGPLVDGLTHCMADPIGDALPPCPDVSAVLAALKQHFAWVQQYDFTTPACSGRFWYVSEEKLEPRLGARYEEPGADKENPLDIARRVQALWRDLQDAPSLSQLRAKHPEHELALARVLTAARHPYAEIQDNLIDQDIRPIDMLRAKLSFFGATKFDPKSALWTRVTLAQGAPLAQDLGHGAVDDWWLPVRQG